MVRAHEVQEHIHGSLCTVYTVGPDLPKSTDLSAVQFHLQAGIMPGSTKSGIMLLFLLLITECLGDLLCLGGGERGCGWKCGLTEQGGGRCNETGDCVCSSDIKSVVNMAYFDRPIEEIDPVNAARSSGLPSFIQQVKQSRICEYHLYSLHLSRACSSFRP